MAFVKKYYTTGLTIVVYSVIQFVLFKHKYASPSVIKHWGSQQAQTIILFTK